MPNIGSRARTQRDAHQHEYQLFPLKSFSAHRVSRPQGAVLRFAMIAANPRETPHRLEINHHSIMVVTHIKFARNPTSIDSGHSHKINASQSPPCRQPGSASSLTDHSVHSTQLRSHKKMTQSPLLFADNCWLMAFCHQWNFGAWLVHGTNCGWYALDCQLRPSSGSDAASNAIGCIRMAHSDTKVMPRIKPRRYDGEMTGKRNSCRGMRWSLQETEWKSNSKHVCGDRSWNQRKHRPWSRRRRGDDETSMRI